MNYAAKQTGKPYDNGSFTVAQLSYLDQVKEWPHHTPYGFFSMPPINSSWCIFPLRGNDNDMVGCGQDYVNRPKDLKEGDVCIFNTKSKVKIILKTTGEIEIIADTATFNIPETTWTGNITLAGDLTQTGDYNLTGTGTASVDFVSAGVSGKGHTHGGVEPGAGNTAAPN
jgi:phage gp45-like